MDNPPTLPDSEILDETLRVLNERREEIERHKQLLMQVVDMKQKVMNQKSEIDLHWKTLIQKEKKECDFLETEKNSIEMQMKNENLTDSKEGLHKLQAELLNKGGNKPPPGRVGNYTIIARRLQGEIKQLEQSAYDMKTRLQQELDRKATLESKVKEMRTGLALHKKQNDPFTAPTTPIN